MQLDTIANVVNGTLADPTSGNRVIAGASIDSRDIASGQLFVPIIAERDGHDFIEAARRAGAAAWFCHRDHPTAREAGALVVDDTTSALQSLGSYVRALLPDRVIAVTGSVGKTSTKDLIAAILKAHGPATSSLRSFNNELGVPLTLINGSIDSWAAVIEMGARGKGHIAELCAIARPTVGVITNIGSAHLEMFGTRDAIADAKSEIVAALPKNGSAVLNRDSDMFARMAARSSAPIVTFSVEPSSGADVLARSIEVDADLHVRFELQLHDHRFPVLLGARGRHQVPNALAAAAAAFSIGVSDEEIATGLATAELSPMRMSVVTGNSGVTVIDDTYNANPVSMKAAIDALGSLSARRRIAVLGTMAELGADREQAHAEIVDYAAERGVTTVLSLNEPAYAARDFSSIATLAEFLDTLGLGADDALLVKGSRVAAMERVVDVLTGKNTETKP
jgi:UDP-N-acetylmuramoyl-tripeptide--D-alanyl-D-alanine ligase